MNIIYNIAANAANGFLKLYSRCLSRDCHRKFPMFALAQQGLTDRIRAEMEADRSGRPRVWFHCASLGEYGVARPLITRLKAKTGCTVVLTFFSPTGYNALSQRPHPDVDHLFHLPVDTRDNARRFIETVRPAKAVFIISEYWPNYLQQLKFHSVPTCLVSAIIRSDSQFFRWYGRIYRKSLSAFKRIFVLNKESEFNLRMLGYTDVTLSGDPLFDNAAQVASTPWHDDVIARFAAGQQVFIAGSISDDRDLAMVSQLADANPDTRFIFVPHEIGSKSINHIQASVPGRSKLYTECSAETDFTHTQVLIIDTMGLLAYIYRYGTWAYVGGGFTPFLHSVIEATVYGLPVAFGPRIERKVTPRQLIQHGIGAMTDTPQALAEWFGSLKNNPARLDEIRRAAKAYVDSNLGATREIVETIAAGLTAATEDRSAQSQIPSKT